MTVTDQIKILNRKIRQNESQYDLDRKAAEKSALSIRTTIKKTHKSKTLEIIDKISKKNSEANKIMSEFKKIYKTLENADLACTKTDNKTKYDFNLFSLPLKFIEKIHNYEITLDEAINDQQDLNILINKLNNNYEPTNTEKIEEKKRILKSARKLQNARKDDY